jgi:8-amino-7-oxononanoate synthase
MDQRTPDEARETVDRVRHALGRPTATFRRPVHGAGDVSQAGSEGFDFSTLQEYEQLKIQKAAGMLAGIENPYYRLHDVRASDTTSINGRKLVNFSSYDYLGLNGHPDVVSAAKRAIDQFGTSCSASRLTAGERQPHRDLEHALATLHGTDDAVSFVSGHATNVSVIGGLMGPEDLIVTDTLIHNSVVEGAKLSGAKRVLCSHGDLESFERALRLNRARHRRALIVVEGLYSMDGDVPDLGALIKLKRRYDAWLMVDEAHSIGVLGAHGRGLAEEQGVAPCDVDIWMGTLSKAFTSAGGYIAGSKALIELLKYTSPGFVYSVGLPPAAAAAACAAIEVMGREGWRLKKLRENGQYFLAGARARNLDTGASVGASVVPVIVGSSPAAVVLSHRLHDRGHNVVPIIFPGVAENQARLRFFLTSQHSAEQIDGVLDAAAAELPEVLRLPSFIGALAGKGGGTASGG